MTPFVGMLLPQMFRFGFNTGFVTSGVLRFTLQEIDDACKDKGFVLLPFLSSSCSSEEPNAERDGFLLWDDTGSTLTRTFSWT